jgi:superfamily II DNA or RNA helicase
MAGTSDMRRKGTQAALAEQMLTAKYQPVMVPGDGCVGATGGLPTLGQALVHSLCGALASPGNPNRGILVWHSTGSGKTCAAAAAMDAFWASGRRILYVSSRAGLRANPIDKFLACPAMLGLPALSKETNFGAKLARRFQQLSFAQLSHLLQIHKPLQVPNAQALSMLLNSSLLIMDEVHNLMRPLPNQTREHYALLDLLLRDSDPRTENAKIVIMTATPGDDITETVGLLNIIRDRRFPPVAVPEVNSISSMKTFSASVYGLVSHVDMRQDSSKYPQMIVDETVMAPMAEKQFEKYLEKVAGMRDEELDFEALFKEKKNNKYLGPARKYSNTQYDISSDMELQEFSAKLPRLLERITMYPQEKHYVYSAFYERRGLGGHGIHAIARFLAEQNGYTHYRVDDAIADMKLQRLPSPSRRYMLLTSRELAGESESKRREASALTALLRVFNSPENARGELVQTILASQGYNEGVDLQSTRHVHLFEPLVLYQAEQQAIGRAVRNCSHRQLIKGVGEWTVSIHRYFSSAPAIDVVFADPANIKADIIDSTERLRLARGEFERSFWGGKLARLTEQLTLIQEANNNKKLMIDQKVFEEAQRKAVDIRIVEEALGRAAVDCIVTKSLHGTAVCDDEAST